MGKKREEFFVAHVCLGSLEPKYLDATTLKPSTKDSKEIILNKDFCERGFVELAPSSKTQSEQCHKYCSVCEANGKPKIDLRELYSELRKKKPKEQNS